jgi:hypothetical protein
MDGWIDGWMDVLKNQGDVSLMQAVGSLMFSTDGTAQGP